ncbi:DUF4823 domain-containing protein [Planctomycetota bacterium]
MRMKMLVLLFALVATGCTSTYKYNNLRVIDSRLDSNRGVLVSVPENGWYETTQYRNSGRMTANAVRAAFLQHAKQVDVTDTCHGDECLESIDAEKHGYYVKPEILHWEERATEWSGKSDRIEIQLVIYDAISKEELANTTYRGKSKWATFGGDHPQDLLAEPTRKYITSLYK